ncbi:MAG: GAF domain-containing protein [Actinobacteria bacterium]|nr:GAF domain-containing protein [Actinomycetota bacterium]
MVGATSGRGDGTWRGRIPHGPRPAIVGAVRDEAELIRAERSILVSVATGVATDTVLQDTARAVERFVEGWRCSVMIADPAGLELHMVAAPSLPASFIAGCQHVRVGRRGGTCGKAAALRERVITPDVGSDPSWGPFLRWVAPYGIRAAWSTPLLDAAGTLLGTFALYHAEVRRPGDAAFEIVDRLGHLAAITLFRDRTAAQVASVRANLEMF